MSLVHGGYVPIIGGFKQIQPTLIRSWWFWWILCKEWQSDNEFRRRGPLLYIWPSCAMKFWGYNKTYGKGRDQKSWKKWSPDLFIMFLHMQGGVVVTPSFWWFHSLVHMRRRNWLVLLITFSRMFTSLFADLERKQPYYVKVLLLYLAGLSANRVITFQPTGES